MSSPIETFVKNVNNDEFLSEQDKKDFILYADLIPKEVIIDINSAAETDKSFISYIWSNISEKKAAILKKDDEAIKNIVEREIDFAIKMESK